LNLENSWNAAIILERMKRKIFSTFIGLISLFLFFVVVGMFGLLLLPESKAPNINPIAPTAPPPTINESMAEEFETLREGQIAFNKPEKMFLGDTTEIKVKITDDLKKELAFKNYIEQKIIRDKIDIYHTMTAELTGIGFDIKPLQKGNTFYVNPSDVVLWRWAVTPTKIGKQKLYLRINAKLTFDGVDRFRTLKDSEHIIEVQVNIGKWFQTNWFKLLEILLTIFGVGTVGFIASKLTVMRKLAEKINSWIKNIYKKLKP